ncbi:MAG: GTP-binding protein, partial [Gammaproteobacteria bacterium]|nr:GTP-binding protein [Gammaproteobacteria bacterium]
LINEFGEIGLDHLMVKELDEDVVLLKSGCICCTVQGELVDGMRELYLKRVAGTLPRFTRVVIETTGLADPLPIVSCLMRDPLFKHAYRLDSLITTVDGVHGRSQLERHREAVRQAAVADRILITKQDLCGASGIQALRARLNELNPGADEFTVEHGKVEPAMLFGANAVDPADKLLDAQARLERGDHDSRIEISDGPDSHDHHHHHHHGHEDVDVNRHDEDIASFCITLDEPVEWSALKTWYEELAEKHGDRVLRVKGIVNVRGESEPFAVHCVQSTQHAPARLTSWPDEDRRSRIVFITQNLGREEVERSLERHRAELDCGPGAPPRPADRKRAGPGRWLNAAELSRLFAALASHEDRRAANALMLMLLTGVTSEDARTARWEEIDLHRRVWLKPAPARGQGAVRPRPRRIVLGEAALTLLAAMHERRQSEAYLFPLESGAGTVSKLETAWSAAAARAGIAGANLRALRPVFASHVFEGLSPELTRSLLGLEPAAHQPP